MDRRSIFYKKVGCSYDRRNGSNRLSVFSHVRETSDDGSTITVHRHHHGSGNRRTIVVLQFAECPAGNGTYLVSIRLHPSDRRSHFWDACRRVNEFVSRKRSVRPLSGAGVCNNCQSRIRSVSSLPDRIDWVWISRWFLIWMGEQSRVLGIDRILVASFFDTACSRGNV